ncbi:MAG: hypothetical protein ACLP8S_04960 [Solirubrobacteraceae bacterium]
MVTVVADDAHHTQHGAEVVDRTREAFERISEAVDDMTARVSQIEAAAELINEGTSGVELSISEGSAVAEQSSASAEEVSTSDRAGDCHGPDDLRVDAGADRERRAARATRAPIPAHHLDGGTRGSRRRAS